MRAPTMCCPPGSSGRADFPPSTAKWSGEILKPLSLPTSRRNGLTARSYWPGERKARTLRRRILPPSCGQATSVRFLRRRDLSKGEDALNVGKSSSQESAPLSCVLPSAPGGKTAPALSWEAVCATLRRDPEDAKRILFGLGGHISEAEASLSGGSSGGHRHGRWQGLFV